MPNAVLGDGSEGTIKQKTGMTIEGNLRSRWWPSVPVMQPVLGDIMVLFKATKYGLDSNYDNSKCVSTLLNTENWNALISSNLKTKAGAENVKSIGSPTVEMWMESWNVVYPRERLECRKKTSDESFGYEIFGSNPGNWGNMISLINGVFNKNRLFFSQTSRVDDPISEFSCWGYFMASPLSLRSNGFVVVHATGTLGDDTYNSSNYCLRPIICLPTSILGEKDSSGKWTLDLD